MCLHFIPVSSKSGQVHDGQSGLESTAYRLPSRLCDGTDHTPARKVMLLRPAMSRPRCSRASIGVPSDVICRIDIQRRGVNTGNDKKKDPVVADGGIGVVQSVV